MTESGVELTNLDPRITKFQNKILEKYIQENKTVVPHQTVIVGSSTVEIFPIENMQRTVQLPLKIYNRGIRATTTSYLLAHLNPLILDLKPDKVFLQIGSNDLAFNVPETTFLENYREIMDKLSEKLPNAEIYIMAYYPINNDDDFGHDEHANLNQARTNARILKANKAIEKLAKDHQFNFINVNKGLFDEKNNLGQALTSDGLHPNESGYQVIFQNLLPYLR